MRKLISIACWLALVVVMSSCLKDETPTKTKMEGVWEVTAAFDQSGKDILDDISFPVVAFHLSSDNTVISTAGPMIMYIVYGDNKYTQIAGSIDQVFNYLSLDFNGGEFFVGGGQQDRFTLEMKLEGLPGQKTLTTLLDMLGITDDWLDVVVYHKFMDVGVDFAKNDNEMIWTLDNVTTAVYNTKDNYGNYVSWLGWPTNNFSRCTFYLTKRTVELDELVQSHR